ncbi:hypothetical protein JHK84_041408 [Glycine max]|nr:hypothetical protein JHK85_041809 [Glycine max]KAG5115295.1 hypothetical protein JHK84_041408 [Glycine max]
MESGNLTRSISRSLSRSSWRMEGVFASGRYSRRTSNVDEDEEALKWAAIERLPTYDRLRTSILQTFAEADNADARPSTLQHREVDVRKLDVNERQEFIDRIFKVAEEDNEKYLRKFRNRLDKVGIRLPTVEVRYQNLIVEADCYIGSRALPTLPNVALNIAESALGLCGISTAKRTKLTILKNVTGIIKPSRMALLLGPPSSGKTTLLLALAGKLDNDLRVNGEISYNGYKLNEFVPRKTSAYISQNDVHIGEMTVKETLDFSARCQGVGTRYGEMIVGPTKTLFMDEISTGLDSSTTYQIVKCFQQIVHLTEATIFMSLLQPAPETFDLFDDIILISEGQIVYQGPRDHIVEFFESCGFRCPERKGTADFLQEVTSRKDQEQYWANRSLPYRYITVSEFANRFKQFHVGMQLENELSVPYDKSRGHRAALVFKKYTVPTMGLLKACWDKEWLLIKRNAFVYVFKTGQIVIIGIIAATVFFRTNMHQRNEADAAVYIGSILFTMIMNMFNGFAELPLTIARLPIFYKHRDHLFHPPWTYTLPNFILRIPITMFEAIVWVLITYYTIGLAPEASRFFKHLLLVFLVQQMAAGMFRFISGVSRTMIIANTGGSLMLLLVFLLGGFILPKSSIPNWWIWGYWISPLTYGYNAFTVNELFAPRWSKPSSDGRTPIGIATLNNFDVFTEKRWYWIGVAALVGFIILYNVLFTFALMYLDPIGKKQAIISEEEASEMEGEGNFSEDPRLLKPEPNREIALQSLSSTDGNNTREVAMQQMGSRGRKTGGYIEGDVRISGFPKNQETFARISGYCEQTDIHSPQVTVRESLIYSAFLRLPKEVNNEEKMKFVDEVMDLVELNNLKDAIVGLPGVTGLSTEQRKRLTIAVELVANPSIIFMDEPTSGLDARAAAIVMRTVRNTVDTGRTVVCTIHQPSIDIFEAFDELLLMKRGGQVIYSGPLGRNSHKIIEYFEAIPEVPKIKDKYNPATWMLEVSSMAAEVRLQMDFAEYYKSSSLYQRNKALIRELGTPPPGAKDLYFPTQYSQSTWEQFKSCLWKQWLTYWRSPDYNLVRFFFTLAAAFLVGTVFWRVGKNRDNTGDLNTIIGALYGSVFFVGVNNCQTVQPVVAVERTVFYRERAAGMYSALPYAIAQVISEIPYLFVQTIFFSFIVYAMVSFEWKVAKVLWFCFVSFFSFMYFTYYGMMTVSITPNHQIASILGAAFYGIFNLFSGFFIPRPKIPKWWVWYYWICPVAWTVYGLIVSQYGDVEIEISVLGASNQTIKHYIEDHYGFKPDFMGPVAAVLVAFPVFFAFVFAFAIKTLNFQTR